MKYLWIALCGILLFGSLASGEEAVPSTQPLAASDMAEIRLLLAQRQVIELQIENLVLRAQLRDGLKGWQLDLQRGVWVAPPKPPETKP